MWKIIPLIALAICVVLTTLPARAQDTEVLADVRCAAVGIVIGRNDPGRRAAGMMLSLYYLGRLDGRAAPNLDIEGTLLKQMSAMTAADYVSEAKRCGAKLTEKGHAIARIEKAMVDHHVLGQPDKSLPAE